MTSGKALEKTQHIVRNERRSNFRSIDLFIIIFFIIIALLGLELFRRDLLQTFKLQNVEPVGTVIVKRNVVQRRLSDRVIWDRLSNESPVYIGDLIRVADISAATVHIDANSIDIDENTLIRITRSADGEGVQIYLSEGSLSLAAERESKSLIIDIKGQQIQTTQGTVMSAAVKEDRQSIQVNEGAVQLVSAQTGISQTGITRTRFDSGAARQISAGSLVTMNSDGTQRLDRAVVVTRPFPNVRYIKNSAEPLQINFSWNRINLEQNQLLRLEISRSSNFSQIANTLNNLDRNASVSFDTGLWFWRILYQNEVLGTGQLTVADGSGVQTISPAFNSIFFYQQGNNYPQLNFQWLPVSEAVSYLLEISDTANFSNTQIQIQSSSTSQIISSLREGMWFWRVKAIFPSVYNGSPSFSTISFFRIEQIVSNKQETARNQSLPLDASLSGVNPDSLASGFDGSVSSSMLGVNTPKISPSGIIISTADETSPVALSLAQWLAAEAPSLEPPPNLVPEIIFPRVRDASVLENPVLLTLDESPAQVAEQAAAQQAAAQQAAQQAAAQEAAPPPLQVTLTSPVNGAQVAGLTALRQPVVFNWSSDAAQITNSRFILSRNANPLQGTPARVISNPARSVNINNLAEGTWYWTVEIQTSDGRIASASPRRLQILAIPLLPAPQNLQPPNGGRIGFAELQSQRSIVFRWSQVQGANAYIFTFSQQNASGRRQIIRTTINNGTSYTINNMRLLDRGTFVWQVEPLNIRNSAIEQRGTIGESTFIIDVPSPSPIQIEDTGILYGN